ncbi:pyruvate dehydrogenase complex dihydrolipoamide acetyltransferase [Owenweeksia hongkongensis]|uniref:pyruvate dehydrogenase complex dihydrolipoamide acetyltransferase n=1 Tax=Owenweeksia hongkongensis TaxID=253245 RepID=UPI003A8EB956
MAEVVTMPRLSDTMEEGTVAKWHKKVGDKVSEGDLLAEIETDKATMDFESFQEGVLLHIGIEEGSTAPVDSILAILGEKGEDISDILEGKSSSESEEKDEKEESKEEKKEGKDEDKKEEKSEKKEESSPESKSKESTSDSSNDDRIKASPLAKKIAEDKGIDLRSVKGTGEGGRIVKQDIDNYKESAAPTAQTELGKESFEDVPVSQMRKVIAKRLAESKFTAPHFYLTLDIDMDAAMEARKSINLISETKISFNDLVVKAVAASLKKHPAVNSSWMGDKIRVNHHVHIGVAVAVEDGLLVPVIRHADQKGLATINGEVKALAEKAKNKKLQPAEWEGNTFTISNLGMFGIEEFTAIVNPPDSCILAVGGIKQVPVVKNGAVVPGNVMKVTLSCDHRVVDGATGAGFLQTFKGLLENPMGLIL